MADAPSSVDSDQLDMLNIEVRNVKRFPCSCGGEWRISFEKIFVGESTRTAPHAICPVNRQAEPYALPFVDPSASWGKMHREKGSSVWADV